MSSEDWLLVARNSNKVTEIRTTNDSGYKVAIVSQFMNKNTLNLRDLMDGTDLKFPNNSGINLSRIAFERLLALRYDILKAFDDLEKVEINS
jgi:hypothetical protein